MSHWCWAKLVWKFVSENWPPFAPLCVCMCFVCSYSHFFLFVCMSPASARLIVRAEWCPILCVWVSKGVWVTDCRGVLVLYFWLRNVMSWSKHTSLYLLMFVVQSIALSSNLISKCSMLNYVRINTSFPLICGRFVGLSGTLIHWFVAIIWLLLLT